jgi:hypothetical protein
VTSTGQKGANEKPKPAKVLMWITAAVFVMLLASISFAYPPINDPDNTLVERKHKGSDQEPGNLPCVANEDGYGVGTDGLTSAKESNLAGKPCHA